MKNQAELVGLLKKANQTIGWDRVQDLLPHPFKAALCKHDTGCQPRISMSAEGLPVITAWEGSVWCSSAYSFNDRDKVLGLKPECAFAEPILEKFFADVEAAIFDHEVSQTIKSTEQQIQQDNEFDTALSAYRHLVTSGHD